MKKSIILILIISAAVLLVVLSYLIIIPEEFEEPKEEDIVNFTFYSATIEEDPLIASCYATSKKDITLCENLDEASEIETCRVRYTDNFDVIVMHKLATGDCANLPDSTFADKKFCNALKEKDCGALKGAQKTVCNVGITKNIDSCKGAGLSQEEETNCIEGANTLFAFQEKGLDACSEIETSIVGKKLCLGLITKDCRTQSTELSKGIALIEFAKYFGETEQCSPIEDLDLKSICLDKTKSYNQSLDIIYGRT